MSVSNILRASAVLLLSQGSLASYPFKSYAQLGAAALQQWYNPSTGLWNGTGWWNSANCMTALGDLAEVDETAKNITEFVFPNTLAYGQEYNLRLKKVVSEGQVHSYYGTEKVDGESIPEVVYPKGFVNGYYDDEGWWALAWIKAYDVTGEAQYLETAQDIFADMTSGWNSTRCGGGIWWDKGHTYVNAIANELFFSVAAHLANRADFRLRYLAWALVEWDWFKGSGMINDRSLVNDGLNPITCKNNGYATWSYNQGVVLGGLVELAKATGDNGYLQDAQEIASAAIKALSTKNGTLHDGCEPDCGGDASQFKGIFMRNLAILAAEVEQDEYDQFIQDNAISIWTNDRSGGNKLGIDWAGPADHPVTASTHSSALDALVAAAARL